jgi:8-oxo-dGTP diphosphatase
MLSPRYRGVVTFINDLYETERMHLFTTDRFEGELTDCDEGEIVWIPRKQLNTLPQWEGDRIFHRLLDEETPFFSLELIYSGEKLLSAILDGKRLHIS